GRRVLVRADQDSPLEHADGAHVLEAATSDIQPCRRDQSLLEGRKILFQEKYSTRQVPVVERAGVAQLVRPLALVGRRHGVENMYGRGIDVAQRAVLVLAIPKNVDDLPVAETYIPGHLEDCLVPARIVVTGLVDSEVETLRAEEA